MTDGIALPGIDAKDRGCIDARPPGGAAEIAVSGKDHPLIAALPAQRAAHG